MIPLQRIATSNGKVLKKNLVLKEISFRYLENPLKEM